MIGAMLGDIIGSPYEFDLGNKSKEFPLFSSRSVFTDDSVMTAAVAEAFLEREDGESDDRTRRRLIEKMQEFGAAFPFAGYGTRFDAWLHAENPRPYGSYGNGSAMRVSSAGWLFDDLDTVLHMARLSAEVTHNHPEGIKGAQATAGAVFLARTGSSKSEIRNWLETACGYDLSRTCDEIRPGYRHVESCQKTVPEAATAFLEGTSFTDVIRTAVSLGGDCDTLTDIAGAMAEGFYGVPEDLQKECRKRLPPKLLAVLQKFEKRLGR